MCVCLYERGKTTSNPNYCWVRNSWMKSSKAHYSPTSLLTRFLSFCMLMLFTLPVQCGVCLYTHASTKFIHFDSLLPPCVCVCLVYVYVRESVCLSSMRTILFDYRFLLPYGWVWCWCCCMFAVFASQKSPKDLMCVPDDHTKHMAGISIVTFATFAVDDFVGIDIVSIGGGGCVFATATTANALLKKYTTHILHAIHTHSIVRISFSHQQSIYLPRTVHPKIARTHTGRESTFKIAQR